MVSRNKSQESINNDNSIAIEEKKIKWDLDYDLETITIQESLVRTE